MNNDRFSAERLRQVFEYNPESGVFKRLSTGQDAWRPAANGYLRLRIDGHLVYQHRAAWLYMHGAWPDGIIDHKDGNRANNAIGNLRIATYSQNLHNSGKTRGASGYKGVFRADSRWEVKIGINGKNVSLGRFDDPAEAHEVYKRKSIECAGLGK